MFVPVLASVQSTYPSISPTATYTDDNGVDAAFIEDKTVAAGVCVGGVVINHGLVGIGHVDILSGERPARWLYAGFGGDAVGDKVGYQLSLTV